MELKSTLRYVLTSGVGKTASSKITGVSVKINLTVQVKKSKPDDHSKTIKIKKSNEEKEGGKTNVISIKTCFCFFFSNKGI